MMHSQLIDDQHYVVGLHPSAFGIRFEQLLQCKDRLELPNQAVIVDFEWIAVMR
jgi:hypothetical protein